MDSDKQLHVPVLAEEVITYLRLKKGMVIVDCTVGEGGHSKAILRGIGEAGYLIGMDIDNEVLREAKSALMSISDRFTLFNANYVDVASVLNKADVTKVDGVLFDLGVSSFQMDRPERGFSTKRDGPLDMRMYTAGNVTASGIINSCSKSELAALFKKYGEEHFAYRIAERIDNERRKQRIETTARLSRIVTESVPYRYRFRKIHAATRVFMALRIAVNREIENLEAGLTAITPLLNKDARLCVISFHSIEDRIVKNRFKELAAANELKIITKKPIRPGKPEKERNPRSRSAKLRVGEKIKRRQVCAFIGT